MKIIDLAFQELDDSDRLRLQQSRNWSKALVVPEHSSAHAVAKVAKQRDADIIVVINKSDAITGVVAPDFVSQSAMKHLSFAKKPNSFVDIVKTITKAQKPGKAGFEWLNYARPELYWCEAGNHFVTKKPCPDHKS